jgi:tetratricopeptide (TPR) repeat protein
LNKAIALAPGFPESYNLLAFVNLVAGDQLDESIALLRKALSLAAGRNDMKYMLAQLYLRKEDVKSARELLEPLVATAPDPEDREHAKMLLAEVERFQAQLERFKSRDLQQDESVSGTQTPRLRSRKNAANESPSAGGARADAGEEELSPFGVLKAMLAKPAEGEQQVRGELVKIECSAKGVVLVINDGQKLVRLAKTSLQDIKFVAYTSDIGGDITCGPIKSANNVIAVFRPTNTTKAKADGEVRVVQLVPKDFK